jgi:hypothetical protein
LYLWPILARLLLDGTDKGAQFIKTETPRLAEASLVNFIGTARGDVLVGTNRDDYFEPRGVSQRPPGTNETDLIDGGAGFDSMSVSATSSCSFVGSAGTGNWTVFASNGDTNVSAVGIEEVYFQGSNEGDVFNTGNATG